jgi:hypothetical protein
MRPDRKHRDAKGALRASKKRRLRQSGDRALRLSAQGADRFFSKTSKLTPQSEAGAIEAGDQSPP